MTAADILAKGHRELFPGVEKAIKAEFARLAKQWHPDRNPDPQAKVVIAHLTEMKAAALGRTKPFTEQFERENGTKFRMEYRRTMRGNACQVYVGPSSVAYLVSAAHEHLADKASARKWTYADKKMEDEFSRFLPRLRREERLVGGRLFIFSRTPDQILMRDLMAMEGKIPGPHVAWMISRMMNLAVYLEWAGISHLSISPEFLLVSLEHHSVSLTGPSLYTTSLGKRPKFAPASTINLLPAMKRPDYEVDSVADRQLIRQVGRELLGDPSGNRIKLDPTVRPEIAQWLSSTPPASAHDDYAAWEACLGERRFVVYPKTAQELYAA